MTKTMGKVRIGIGGWVYAPWRGTFFPKGLPQKQELAYASQKMTSIEVNSTYYGAQKRETFAKWHDEAPDDFVFSLKGPRFTTNRRLLAEAGESIEQFFASGLMALKDKLGPINWQFMPAKTFDPVDFERFLKLLPQAVEGRTMRHAVEVRHPSFATEEFVAMAKAYKVAIVIGADSQHPQINDLTAPFVYARLMGTQENEPKGYSDDHLAQWAQRAGCWSAGKPTDLPTIESSPNETPRDVFLYVISGFKERNPLAAMDLIERVKVT